MPVQRKTKTTPTQPVQKIKPHHVYIWALAVFALFVVGVYKLVLKEHLFHATPSQAQETIVGKTSFNIQIHDLLDPTKGTYRPEILVGGKYSVDGIIGKQKTDTKGLSYYSFENVPYTNADALEIRVRLQALQTNPDQENYYYYFTLKPVANGVIKLPGIGTDNIIHLFPWKIAITNAANGKQGAFTRNSLVAIYGQNLISSRTQNCPGTFPWPTTLCGVKAEIHSYNKTTRTSIKPVPLQFASFSQVNAYIPDFEYRTTGDFREEFYLHTGIDWKNQTANIYPTKIQPTLFGVGTFAPGLFTKNASGTQLASAHYLLVEKNPPYTQTWKDITATSPAVVVNDTKYKSYLVLYVTGLGTSSTTPMNPPPKVKIDGNANVLTPEYAGRVAGIVGQQQLNIPLPSTLNLDKKYDPNDPTLHIVQVCDAQGAFCTSPGPETVTANPQTDLTKLKEQLKKTVFIYIKK